MGSLALPRRLRTALPPLLLVLASVLWFGGNMTEARSAPSTTKDERHATHTQEAHVRGMMPSWHPQRTFPRPKALNQTTMLRRWRLRSSHDGLIPPDEPAEKLEAGYANDLVGSAFERPANYAKESCFHEEQNLLVCMCSYANSQRAAFIDSVLRNLANLHLLHGLRVDVKLYYSDVSHPHPLEVKLPPGVTVQQQWANENLKHHFSGLCRQDFNRSLARDEYSYYLFVEDDMNVTANNLVQLCEEFRFLNMFPEHKFLRPGLVRYETKAVNSVSQRLLTDNSRCCPPQIDRIIQVGQRKYVVPTNPYEALYFLPATHFKRFLAEHLARYGYGYAQDLSFTEGLGLGIREHHAGFWMKDLVTKIVPIEHFEEFLVHHMSNNYINNRLPSVEQYLNSAQNYNGTPISLGE